MFMFLSKKLQREQATPLNEAQRSLVEKKFEILRQASFGFTHDRLLHIQEEDLKGWTDACTGELRRKITLAAPSHIKIALIDFRTLRCVSLQCLPVRMHADGARLADSLGPAPAPSISKEGVVEAGGFVSSPPSSPIPVRVRRGEAVTSIASATGSRRASDEPRRSHLLTRGRAVSEPGSRFLTGSGRTRCDR